MAAMTGEQRAIEIVEGALRSAFAEPGGKITPATETEIQKALTLLRSEGRNRDVLQRAEALATMVFKIALAQRTGRPNFYASKMLRLKRAAAA
jgi:hypothetical protein